MPLFFIYDICACATAFRRSLRFKSEIISDTAVRLFKQDSLRLLNKTVAPMQKL